MTDLQFILGLATVAVLSTYLVFKHIQRTWDQLRNLPPGYNPAEWTGKGINVDPIKPALQKVRQDYLLARSPARGICFHKSLLQFARRAIARFAYFHGPSHEQPDAVANQK